MSSSHWPPPASFPCPRRGTVRLLWVKENGLFADFSRICLGGLIPGTEVPLPQHASPPLAWGPKLIRGFFWGRVWVTDSLLSVHLG